ncbi:4-hydroxybenzoate polyprenyltransferase [Clavibacter sp. B3I6]|uniref:prenyltransferase n=1 Tax=Clavibacter sp. B3I6 TaxID=3042268 RepID=UPI0027836E2A|nr:prenyltransferase [Clavibacter sp. B3I6]MDQ0744921.1 4-hydroxybenzoate polyprenyltransferase [Clavibacter sp. B3I6]
MSDVRTRPGVGEVLRTIVLSSRPLSWVNTAFPFAAAYLTVTRELDLTAVLGTLFFLVPYNLAMYGINDVFDYESDMRNPRKGGVEGAVLARAMHRPVLVAVLLVNLPFLAYLVIVGSAASTAVLAVSVFAVVAYSLKGLRFKERPILDSLTSSTHFTSPAVYGIVLAGGAFTPALWAILAAFFLWGVASHAFGAVQDIVADRDGGISSIATVLGGAATVRIAVLAYAAAGLAMLATGLPGIIAAVLVIPYILSTAPFWSIRDEEAEAANRGWRRFLGLNFLSGFVVTLLLIVFWRTTA